jgi:hypothetical protein
VWCIGSFRKPHGMLCQQEVGAESAEGEEGEEVGCHAYLLTSQEMSA